MDILGEIVYNILEKEVLTQNRGRSLKKTFMLYYKA